MFKARSGAAPLILIIAGAFAIVTSLVIGNQVANKQSVGDIRNQAASGSCQGVSPPNCTVSGIPIAGCGGRSESNCRAVASCGCTWVADTAPQVVPTSPPQVNNPPVANTNNSSVCGSASARACNEVGVNGRCTGFPGTCRENNGGRLGSDGKAVCGCVADAPTPTSSQNNPQTGSDPCEGHSTGQYWCDGSVSKYCIVANVTASGPITCVAGSRCVTDSRRCLANDAPSGAPIYVVSTSTPTIRPTLVATPTKTITNTPLPRSRISRNLVAGQNCTTDGLTDANSNVSELCLCQSGPDTGKTVSVGSKCSPIPVLAGGSCRAQGEESCVCISGPENNLVKSVGQTCTPLNTPTPTIWWDPNAPPVCEGSCLTRVGACPSGKTATNDRSCNSPAGLTIRCCEPTPTKVPTPTRIPGFNDPDYRLPYSRSTGDACSSSSQCASHWCNNGKCEVIDRCNRNTTDTTSWASMPCSQCPNGFYDNGGTRCYPPGAAPSPRPTSTRAPTPTATTAPVPCIPVGEIKPDGRTCCGDQRYYFDRNYQQNRCGQSQSLPAAGQACTRPHGTNVYQNLYCCNLPGNVLRLQEGQCSGPIDTGSAAHPLPDHTWCFYVQGIGRMYGSCMDCISRKSDGSSATYKIGDKDYCGLAPRPTSRPTAAPLPTVSSMECDVNNIRSCNSGSFCQPFYLEGTTTLVGSKCVANSTTRPTLIPTSTSFQCQTSDDCRVGYTCRTIYGGNSTVVLAKRCTPLPTLTPSATPTPIGPTSTIRPSRTPTPPQNFAAFDSTSNPNFDSRSITSPPPQSVIRVAGESCTADTDCNTHWCDNGQCKVIDACFTPNSIVPGAYASKPCSDCPNGIVYGGLFNSATYCAPPAPISTLPVETQSTPAQARPGFAAIDDQSAIGASPIPRASTPTRVNTPTRVPTNTRTPAGNSTTTNNTSPAVARDANCRPGSCLVTAGVPLSWTFDCKVQPNLSCILGRSGQTVNMQPISTISQSNTALSIPLRNITEGEGRQLICNTLAVLGDADCSTYNPESLCLATGDGVDSYVQNGRMGSHATTIYSRSCPGTNTTNTSFNTLAISSRVQDELVQNNDSTITAINTLIEEVIQTQVWSNMQTGLNLPKTDIQNPNSNIRAFGEFVQHAALRQAIPSWVGNSYEITFTSSPTKTDTATNSELPDMTKSVAEFLNSEVPNITVQLPNQAIAPVPITPENLLELLNNPYTLPQIDQAVLDATGNHIYEYFGLERNRDGEQLLIAPRI